MSQIQSFFIRAGSGIYDCEDLNHFLRSHKIVRLNEGFVNSGAEPGFQILVEYAENSSQESTKSQKRIDYRAQLKDDKQIELFDALKAFRAELCKRQKLIGAYMIAKDEHLFALVKNPTITVDEIIALPHSANIKLNEFAHELHDELQRLLTSK